jgi:hypothetical protein
MRRKKQLLLTLIILVNFFLIQDNVGSIILANNSHELIIEETVNIGPGESLTFQNKIIYYDSSTSPVFFNSGTLTMIDCQVIPLKDAVDFIHTYDGNVHLENVTIINSVFNNTAKLIDADGSDITLIDSTFKGFARADIRNDDDLYISNCQFNVTEKIYFQTTNNLTILDSNFDLSTNESTILFEVRFSDGCRLYNNTFTSLLSAALDLGAWLVAVEFRESHNIEFVENKVKNAGKVFVAYNCSNLAVKNNSLANEEFVSGSELQIAGGCKDVLIANNTMWNLHDSVEIYDHENITVIGNHITTDVLGFYVKPENRTAPTEVYILNNTQIGGSISAQYTRGLIIDDNTFIRTAPIHLINSSDAFVTNNRMTNSSINNWNTINTTIDGNEFFIEPGYTWLHNDNSSTIMGTNTIHYLEHNNPEITNVQINPADPLDNETIDIRADITDETAVQYVRFHYRINGSSWDTLEMTSISGDAYEVNIGPYGNATDISFYISARDTSYYENIGVEDQSSNFYNIQILVFEQEPEPTPTPTPEPSPSPEPPAEPEPRGIPGYPMESLLAGLATSIFVLWFRQRTS